MKTLLTCALVLLVIEANAAQADIELDSYRPFARVDHREALQKHCQALGVDHTILAEMSEQPACTLERIPLDLVSEVDLVLFQVSPVADDAIATVVEQLDHERRFAARQATIWRGSVVGDASSEVFLSYSPAGLFGWVETAGVRWMITSGDPTGERTTVIYPENGVAASMIKWLPFQCGTLPIEDPQFAPATPTPPASGGIAGSVCMTIEIAIDTDNAFLEIFDGDEAAAMGYVETLVASTNIIYERDLNTQFQIVYTRFWGIEDPWSGTDTNTRLPEFKAHWNNQMDGVSRDVAHLLCGDDLGGGRAYTYGVCDPEYAYGVSGDMDGYFPTPLQSFHYQNWDIIVFTHELGHNCGSPHTHDYCPPIDQCPSSSAWGPCQTAQVCQLGTLMSYCHWCPPYNETNIELAFHPTVQDEIRSFLVSRSCLDDVQCGDPDDDGIGAGDNCPFDANNGQEDSDGDGVGDACDGCPLDPLKTFPGACGCGNPDTDDDGDGVPDCLDGGFDVPDDFPTIQAAIDAAPMSGTIINVAAGTWPITETIDLLGKELTVRGATDNDGNPATVVDGQGLVRVFSCLSGEGNATALQDLEITGGTSTYGGGLVVGGALPADASSIRVENCIFRANSATSGGAVYVNGDESDPTFTDCTFIDNSASSRGGAIFVRQQSSPFILRCVFANNTCGTVGGAIANAGTDTIRVQMTAFCGNTLEMIDGAWSNYIGNCFSNCCSDSNADGLPDDCSDGCMGDYDCSGAVDGADLGAMLAAWGSNNPALDLDGNDVINGGDLGILLSSWAWCAP